MKTYYSPKEIKKHMSGYATEFNDIAEYPRLTPELLLFGFSKNAIGKDNWIYPQADSIAKLIDHPNMEQGTLDQGLALYPEVRLAFLYAQKATQEQFNSAVDYLLSLDIKKLNANDFAAAVEHPLSNDSVHKRILLIDDPKALKGLFKAESHLSDDVFKNAENNVPMETEFVDIIEYIIKSGRATRDYIGFVTSFLFKTADSPSGFERLVFEFLSNAQADERVHKTVYRFIKQASCNRRVKLEFLGALTNSERLPEQLAERIIDDIQHDEYIRDLFFDHQDFYVPTNYFAGLLKTHALRQKLLPLLLDTPINDKINTFIDNMREEDFKVQSLDDLLLTFEDWRPHSLVNNPHITPEWLDILADHYDEFIRCKVAVHPNIAPETELKLKWVRKKLQSEREFPSYIPQSMGFPTLKGMSDLNILCSEYGYDIFDFFNETSQSRTLKTLIGSKHKEEIRFFFGSNDARSITAISSLQTLFTNQKGKLDRMGYLAFLKAVNDGLGEQQCHAGLAVDAQSLRTCFDFFSTEEIIAVLKNNQTHEAQDVFRMTAALIENDDPDESARQARMIRKWLNTNSASNMRFHDYLSKKESRQRIRTESQEEFPQALPEEQIDALSPSLPDGWKLRLPSNSKALRKLGRDQRHCVGSTFYAKRCEDGSSVIFALVEGGCRDRTYTFQFSVGGSLNQAKGFANSSVPDEVRDMAYDFFPALSQAIETRQCQKAAEEENK